jgi:hypothetical protein
MALIKISTVLTASWDIIIPRPTERGGQPGGRLGAHEFRGPTSCFLNHNSSIHFCCTDSLLMTHRGGISLSIIIWRIGGGGPSFLLSWGPQILLATLIIPLLCLELNQRLIFA